MTVDAEVESVWRVLTSFEAMPAHLSGLRQCRILEKNGTYLVVEQTVRGGIPLLPISIRVVLDVIEERPFLHFNQRNGTFTSFRGYWRVDRSSVGTASQVLYYLEASLGQGLKRRVFEQQLHRTIRQKMQELKVWIENSGI